MTTTSLTEDQLERLAHEKADLEKSIEQATARLAEINSTFISLGEGGHRAGIFTVVVETPKPSMLIKANLVAEHYPFSAHPQLYKIAADTAKVKAAAALGGVDLALVQEPSNPTTKVKVL